MSVEILIDIGLAETRVALIEDGRLAQLAIDRPHRHSLVGTIWLGRVNRVVQGMQAAFIDIGLGKAGFLAARDARSLEKATVTAAAAAAAATAAPSDAAIVTADEVAGDESFLPARVPPIGDLLNEGQAVLVQAIKDPVGDKGIKLSTDVSLPGRLLVLTPFSRGVHVSRRLEAAAERDRLIAALGAVAGDELGFILRTAAAGAPAEDLLAEAVRLKQEWQAIVAAAAAGKAPALVWQDIDPVARALRDNATPTVERIRINTPAGLAAAKAYAETALPGLAERIVLHTGPGPLFALFDAEAQLARALRKRVGLPSGGAITIETTEALTAVDVDSGSFTAGHGLEETSLHTNLEAATEIAHQLRLRGIGGIIVIDFIHLEEAGHRAALLAHFTAALAADRAPTRVLSLSEFGLVEMTRKRTGEPLAIALSENCPSCAGSGRLPAVATVAADLLRRAEREAAATPGRPLTLIAAPDVAGHLETLAAGQGGLARLLGVAVQLRADSSCRREQFDVVVE